MAYLTELRQIRPGPGNWPKNMALWNDAPHPSIVLDEIDDTLNSWQEAHNLFEYHQKGQDIDLEAHRGMATLVHQVIKDRLQNTVTSYPPAVFAWALLERWMIARGRPQGYRIHLGNRIYLHKNGLGMGGIGKPPTHYLRQWVIEEGNHPRCQGFWSIDRALELTSNWPLRDCYDWTRAVIRREVGLPEEGLS